MLFGLWGSNTKKEKDPVVQKQRPSRDHRLENALKNFIKFGEGENILSRRDELRAGSLGYLASRINLNLNDEVETALDNLEKLGAFQDKSKAQIIASLEKVFSKRELKTHYSSKTSQEIDAVHNFLRSRARSLSQEENTKAVNLAA